MPSSNAIFGMKAVTKFRPVALMSWGAYLVDEPHVSVEVQQKKLNITSETGTTQIF